MPNIFSSIIKDVTEAQFDLRLWDNQASILKYLHKRSQATLIYGISLDFSQPIIVATIALAVLDRHRRHPVHCTN
jgi:hypothetical protein